MEGKHDKFIAFDEPFLAELARTVIGVVIGILLSGSVVGCAYILFTAQEEMNEINDTFLQIEDDLSFTPAYSKSIDIYEKVVGSCIEFVREATPKLMSALSSGAESLEEESKIRAQLSLHSKELREAKGKLEGLLVSEDPFRSHQQRTIASIEELLSLMDLLLDTVDQSGEMEKQARIEVIGLINLQLVSLRVSLLSRLAASEVVQIEMDGFENRLAKFRKDSERQYYRISWTYWISALTLLFSLLLLAGSVFVIVKQNARIRSDL